MKNLFRKVSFTLVLAVLECALGVLLLAGPAAFTTAIIAALGVAFAAAGVYSATGYCRLPREEAARTWKLSIAVAGVALGLTFILNREWLAREFGMLSLLYGLPVAISVFLKLQMCVDALRARRKYWYLMAISFALSTALAALLALGALPDGDGAWRFMGVALILIALLDAACFALGWRKARADRKAEQAAREAAEEKAEN